MFRVVHDFDIAVHLPCCQVGLFLDCVDASGKFSPWHIRNEIFYNSAFSSWRKCNGKPYGEDRDCANQYFPHDYSIDKHKHYFNVHTSKICDIMVSEPNLRRSNMTSNHTLS